MGKKVKKESLSAYDTVLKALGGPKWLRKAKPEQVARLNTLKELDQLEALVNITKEQNRKQAKP